MTRWTRCYRLDQRSGGDMNRGWRLSRRAWMDDVLVQIPRLGVRGTDSQITEFDRRS